MWANSSIKWKWYINFYDVPDEHQTSASLSSLKLKDWDGYNGEILEYEVKVNTFDYYLEKNGIKNVDLVKIDEDLNHISPFLLPNEENARFNSSSLFNNIVSGTLIPAFLNFK